MSKQTYEEAKSILQDSSKEDLILFILNRTPYYITPIKKSELLYFKWEKEHNAWIKEHELLTYELMAIDGKERSRLASLFNAEKDLNLKFEIAKKAEPYHRAFKKYFDKSAALDDRLKKIQALYALIEKTREEENK